MIVLVLNVI